jgi:hypothetical protein
MTASRGIRVRRGTRQRWLKENQGKHFCHCGCGAVIPLRVEHFNYGVPKYLLGHNSKADPPRKRETTLVSVPCGCGCGSMTTPGRKFLSGHNQRGQKPSAERRAKISAAMSGERNHRYGKLGEQSASWKGGRQRLEGYVLVYSPNHPFASKRYVMEHRLIYEAWLREHEPDSPLLVKIEGELYLRPADEVQIHHRDEIKDHNVIENLEAVSPSEHMRIHLPALIAARWPNRKD